MGEKVLAACTVRTDWAAAANVSGSVWKVRERLGVPKQDQVLYAVTPGPAKAGPVLLMRVKGTHVPGLPFLKNTRRT